MADNTIHLTAAMRENLFSMQHTQKLMDTTQTRLASGLKVQSALDDPINYFAAKGHRDRSADLQFRKDEMGEAVQTLKAANNGIESLQELVASAKSLAQSALSSDATSDTESLRVQFNAVLQQINTLSDDSGYKGINLLDGTTVTLEVRFDETGEESNLTLQGFLATDVTDNATSLDGIFIAEADNWTVATGAGGRTAINDSITELDNARSELRSQAKRLSNDLSTITTRDNFTTQMIQTLENGAGNLTLADMNEEGANMLMLQTRQQLGTTSLSIASQAAQAVLRLF